MYFDKFSNKFKKRLYFRMLIPFIALTVLIVISASFVFSTSYLNMLYEQIVTESRYSIERLSTDIDNLFSQLSDTTVTLNENTEVNTYLHNSVFDGMSILHADKFMKYISNTNTYVNTVIIYNRSAEFPIMSGKTNIDFKQFVNSRLKQPDIKNPLQLFFCSLSDPSNKREQQTISSIYSDSWYDNGSFDNAIILVLNKQEIEKKILGKFDGANLIVDNSGKVVFSNYNDLTDTSIEKSSYFTKILAAEENQGHFIEDIANNNKIITYSKNSESGFYIINFKSYDNITTPMREKRNKIIIISILLSLGLGTLAYFISRFAYSPIGKVTEMFKYAGNLQYENGLDEVTIISKVFRETQEHIKKLEIKTLDNNQKLKEEFLRKLLKTDKLTATTYDLLEEYHFNIVFSNLIFISIRIDNYNVIDNDEKNIYIKTMCKIIPQMIKEHFRSEIVDMFEGEFVLMTNYVNYTENNFDMLLQAMDNLRDASRKTLGITLSIGIGGVANSVDECSDAYKKAVEMVKHRFVLGIDKTISQKYVEENLSAKICYPIEMEDQLIKAIRSNNKDLFVKKIDDTFELLKSFPYSEAVSVFFQVTSTCFKTINQITSQDSNKFYLYFDEISNVFSSVQTLDQAKIWLMDIFTEYQVMLEGVNQLKNSKHYNFIQKTQAYIKQNYHDINLSVESLAESVGYTPYYFSRIFKEITGVNVADYVRQIRVEKAKEFLCQDRYKINEIPDLVGFTNISHFYSVFKKGVGLTPAAYKEYVNDSTKNYNLNDSEF